MVAALATYKKFRDLIEIIHAAFSRLANHMLVKAQNSGPWTTVVSP
jgi:hypothetical protein